MFYILFILSLKFGAHLALTVPVKPDIKFSLSMFDLYLNFMKFIIEKVGSRAQIFETYIKSFLINESSNRISFSSDICIRMDKISLPLFIFKRNALASK